MVLLDESRECSGVILVLSGIIRIYKLSEEGKEITSIALAEVKPVYLLYHACSARRYPSSGCCR